MQGVVESVNVDNLNRQNIKKFFFISFDRNISFSPSESFIQFDKRIRKQFETFPSPTDKRTISQEQKIQEMFYINDEFENKTNRGNNSSFYDLKASKHKQRNSYVDYLIILQVLTIRTNLETTLNTLDSVEMKLAYHRLIFKEKTFSCFKLVLIYFSAPAFRE